MLKDDAKYYALKKIPNLKNIDGIIVQATFSKKADEFPDVFPPPLKWYKAIVSSSIFNIIFFRDTLRALWRNKKEQNHSSFNTFWYGRTIQVLGVHSKEFAYILYELQGW